MKPLTPCRRSRVDRGLTLFDLFRRTKIQVSRLSLLERGLVEPRPVEIARIARALETDAAQLFPAGSEQIGDDAALPEPGTAA